MEVEITSQSEKVAQLEETIQNSTDISESMRQIEKELYDMNLTSRYDLFKKFSVYLNLTSKQEIESLKENLTHTRIELDKIDLSTTNYDRIKELNKKTDDEISVLKQKIVDLKNKVHLAQHTANSIRVAMGLSNNCKMSYHVPQTEVLRSLSITYKCNSLCELFNWSNNQGDSMIIKVQDGSIHIKFSSNNTPHKIKLTPEQSDSENTLIVERSGAKIEFRAASDHQKTKSIYIGSKLIVIEAGDEIRVGSEGKAKNSPYIYKIIVNDKTIGVWKFATTSGTCNGEPRVVKEKEGLKPFYTGIGYRMFTSSLNPGKFNLKFNFSTFDENSLIYLAQEMENPCAYIGLYLANGHIVLKVTHNNNQTVQLSMEEKYNDGKNHFVDLTMAYSKPYQNYNLHTDLGTNQTQVRLPSKHVFRLKKAHHFVGGVQPIFDASCVPSDVNTTSFLGFLDTSDLSNEIVGYGVQRLPGELNLHKAWFLGDGYLKLSKKIPKLEHLHFIIRPESPDGTVMVLDKLGVISLMNFKLKLFGDYESTKMLNPHDYNVVELEFKKDGITVKINGEDDIELRQSRTHKQNLLQILLGSDANGGSFRGGISDIVINNSTLLFNADTVQEHYHVELGREPPLTKRTPNLKGLYSPANVANSMQNTEGCAATGMYTADPNAVQFGDKPNSFIHVKTGHWKKNYTVYFEFRTFYPNGVLFLATGYRQPPQYNLLELKEGRISLHIKGRKKVPKTISFSNQINDGKWHKIKINKKGKKLEVTLDGERRKPIRVAKSNVKNELLLGGVPKDYTDYRELENRLHPFRGCLKSFIINDEQPNLMKNSRDIHAQNITLCFPHVEEGAYFGGDAYAVYRQNFQVNKVLELGFEFRTAEQNGILLSVSNENNFPALSVELQNGAVVMTIDMGNGVVSNVTNNLDSDFALCNNKWHNVTALYSTSELTVNVDGIRKSWVHDVNSLMGEIDAPLYVGGLPDDAPTGTLKTRENFKGCIRKLKIEERLMDWSDMEQLNHVLLNSCPVVPGNV